MGGACATCGTVLTRHNQRRFCSTGCSNGRKRGGSSPARRACAICGQAFRAKMAGQRACSRVCGRYVRFGFPNSVVEWNECKACSRSYTTRGRRRCACRTAVLATARQPVPRECVRCGSVFTSWQRGASMCSERCRRKASKLRRRVREANSYGEWRWSDFMRMAARFDYCCAYCGEKPERLDPDHVVPLSQGGPNVLNNLLPTCFRCNSDKSAMTLDEWADSRVRRGLPPRQTSWAPEDRRYWHLTSLVARHERAS